MDGDKTLIDPQADVEGTLKGKDAQILGRFKGEVTVSGRLVMGEGSRVEANVDRLAVVGLVDHSSPPSGCGPSNMPSSGLPLPAR